MDVLDEFLARAKGRVAVRGWELGREGHATVRSLVGELTPAQRVALLKSAVAKLPRLRELDGNGASVDGTLVYATVGALYGARLPLTEADLCEVLLAAGHDCGHGLDTRPPFDLARKYMRKHGYSAELGAAIVAFVENLPRSSAIQVKELRRSAALIAVLGPTPVGHRDGWIRSFQGHVAALEAPERQTWEDLVVAMSVSERMVMPNTWRAPAESAVQHLGADRVVERLRHWWPVGGDGVVDLQDGGSQVLKHFIWLLALLPRPGIESLVTRLAGIRFKGRSEPMAVLKPAAAYLEDAMGAEAQQARDRLLARVAAAGG